ncbi:hypothetical protein IEQ34_012710 [Dendrobium chrysotoxum]|uniref:Uncharacterized protein n=1 Tax=Dendrobium chrysotoxum TaxID=161865 RepID=A0AAV7G683_DENCH|nr:hypothetical protein IEQ34_012710 [Dendrobium chrysotoxum]
MRRSRRMRGKRMGRAIAGLVWRGVCEVVYVAVVGGNWERKVCYVWGMIALKVEQCDNYE